MRNGHHLFEQMMSFSRGPKKHSRLSGLYSSFPSRLSPLVKLTEQTAEASLELKCHKQSHRGDHTGSQHTECASLCYLWENKKLLQGSQHTEGIYFMDTCGPHRNQSLQQGTDAKRHPHAEGSIIATAPGKPEKLQWMVSVFGIKVSGSLFNEMNKQNKISRKYRD